MQHLDVEGVHDVVVHVQPGIGHHLRAVGVAVRAHGVVRGEVALALLQRLQVVVARQHRHPVRRAHIGPDQAVALLHRIPGLARRFPVQAAVGLAGLLQAHALHAELPAMVAAADAVRLDVAIEERGAAVHAARIEQARPPRAVAEDQQVFAQYPDLLRPRGDVAGRQHRLPEAAHVLPAGRPRAHLGEELVGMLLRAAVGDALQLGGGGGGGGHVVHGAVSLI